MEVVVGSLALKTPESEPVEIVERKGLGHPDTICDAVSERFSVELSRYYLERFGKILHHNVDKALLSAGAVEARFGGGRVVEPWQLFLAGRAVTRVGDEPVPVEELAAQAARGFVHENLRAVDPGEHVRIHCLVQQGSADLTDLFARGQERGGPRANDTSFGVGYAPETPLERLVTEAEQAINSRAFRDAHPASGEDVKVMGIRREGRVLLTVARALIDRHLEDLSAYLEAKEAALLVVARIAEESGFEAEVTVNAGDDLESKAVYLTVTGTSAEAGDDGQVGRGNRANGLITPFRPMSLEALAGKNAVNHIGKLYNLAARQIAEAVVAEIEGVRAAECYIVSQIGAPITRPRLLHLRLRPEDGVGADEVSRPARDLAGERIAVVAELWRDVIEGRLQIY